MTPAELRERAYAVIAAGGRGMTLTVPIDWVKPAGFPRCELLSINARGEKNLRVLAHRVIEWLNRSPLE